MQSVGLSRGAAGGFIWGLWRVYIGSMHSSAGGGMEGMDKPGRDPGLEPSLLTPHLQKRPEHICSHGNSREIVQSKAREGWHRECGSATETRTPGCFCLSFPRGMQTVPSASPGCHAGLSPGSTCVFLFSLIHLCRAAMAELLIASAGKAGALGRL